MQRKAKTTLILSCAVAALTALATASPAWAVEEHLFDPVLSLEGDCNGDDGAKDPSCPYQPPPEGPKALEVPCGVATDTHGGVYVASPGVGLAGINKNGRIDVFDPQGRFLTEIPNEDGPCGLAVDSAGNVYVVTAPNEAHPKVSSVYRYEPSSYPPSESTSYALDATLVFEAESSGCGLANSVAVDPSDDHLYVGRRCRVEEYGSAAEGTPLNPLLDCCIGEGLLRVSFGGYGAGVDVYGANHDVYVGRVGDKNNNIPATVFLFDGSDGQLKCEADLSETPDLRTDTGFRNGAIAVDQASGDFYLYDSQFRVVDHFAVPAGGGCPKFVNQLPSPPTLTGDVLFLDIAFDAPIVAGEAGYDSPNEGYAYVTSGTTDKNSHLYAFQPRAGGPPEVEAQRADGVTETEAVLRAALNPNAFETAYHFELTTQSAFEQEGYAGAVSVPLPDALLGDGGAFVAVSAPLGGLQPDTSYRFRLVASNCAAEEAPDQCLTVGEGKPGEVGEDARFATYPSPPAQSPCPNAALRAGPAAALPDCRAYELVTPPDTQGHVPTMSMMGQGFADNNFYSTMASPDGESLVFGSKSGAFPGIGGGGYSDVFEARRDALDGWQSSFISLDGAQAAEPIIGGIAPEHRYSFLGVASQKGTMRPLLTARGGYLRVPPGVEPSPNCAVEAEPAGRFEWIGCGSLGTEPEAHGRSIAAGGEHVLFFTASNAEIPPTRLLQLEPCAPPTGIAAIYDRTPGGPTRCVSVPPTDASEETEARFEASDAAYRGVSADGTAVAFSVLDTLYVRLDNTETLEVAGGNPTFAGISSAHGGRVFFLQGGDLFACDLAEGGCAGEEAHTPLVIAAEVTLVNVAADGSRAYFVSEDDLVGGEANEWGANAEAGAQNLYAWDGSSVRFVAPLDPDDVEGEQVGAENRGLGLWVSNFSSDNGPANELSRSTPDGTVLVFESRASLTDYDSAGRREVYRYDAEAEPGMRLACISCNPTGAAAASDAMLQSPGPISPAQTFPPVNSLIQIANVTTDGETVFFQSGDRLVPGDLDGYQDVYEWEAAGKGGCTRPAGCLGLVSSGRSSEDDYLYAMTPDGSDVFFLSGDTLVAQDPDRTHSIYDARVGGGFPPPVAPPGDCLGEACQPAVAAPNDATPATSSHRGPGNPSAQPSRTRCPKGKRKVRRAGKTRCVKRQTKKAQRKRHDNRRAQR